MKKQKLLKRFEYSIPPSAIVSADVKKDDVAAEYLPLMEVDIDFENGHFKLEGYSHFITASNAYTEASWFTYNRERIQIETDIYPSVVVNLNNSQSDSLVFPMDGIIKDCNWLIPCSGLLVIDKDCGPYGHISDQWNITCYLYDLLLDEYEIKFTFPVYLNSSDECVN